MRYAGHLRDAFIEWLEEGMPDTATVEVNYEPRRVPAEKLLGIMWHCTDTLPSDVRDEVRSHLRFHELPSGGFTYAQAAQALHAERVLDLSSLR